MDITTKKKTIEQFRQELVDAIYSAIREETIISADFTKEADYFRAKLAEAKIEGLHKALGIMLDASIVEVKEK